MNKRSRFLLSFLLSFIIASEMRPADPLSIAAAVAAKTVVVPIVKIVGSAVLGMSSYMMLRRNNRIALQASIAQDAMRSQPTSQVTETVTASQSQPTSIDTNAIQPAMQDYTGPSVHASTNLEHRNTVNVGTDAISALNLVHDLGNVLCGVSAKEAARDREIEAYNKELSAKIPLNPQQSPGVVKEANALLDKRLTAIPNYTDVELDRRQRLAESSKQSHLDNPCGTSAVHVDILNKELASIKQERTSRVKKQAITTASTYMVLTTQTAGTTTSTIVEPEKKPTPGCPPATPVEVVKATTSPATPMNPEPNPGFTIVDNKPLTLITIPFEQRAEDFILTKEKFSDNIDNKESIPEGWEETAFPEKDDKQLINHIFPGKKTGHADFNDEIYELLKKMTEDRANFKGKSKHGKLWWGKVNPDGTESWAYGYKGKIRSAGINIDQSEFCPEKGMIKKNPKKSTDL